MESIAETLFPYIALPVSLIALMFSLTMFLEMLVSYGCWKGELLFALSRRSRFFHWLFIENARLGQDVPPESIGLQLGRFILIGSIGLGMLIYWIMTVTG